MSKDLTELLREAVKLEEDGRTYYLDVAKRTKNALARRTFEVLASEEVKHRTYIEAYYQRREREQGWPSMQEVGVEKIERADRARNVFEEAAKHAAEAVTDETHLDEAYEHAADLEKKSIEFYQNMLKSADSPELREFLEFLVAQEREHLELLSQTHHYVQDPAGWFFDEEHWIVEG